MKRIERAGSWYWENFTDSRGGWRPYAGRPPGPPPGEELARLRRGLGKTAGTTPEMWGFFRAVIPDDRRKSYTDDWEPPHALVAEHHALALYGRHQQSQSGPMHKPGRGLGDAVRILRGSERFSPEAVDRRFFAAVTATSLTELARHLRGLVGQLKVLKPAQPLDYSQLVEDLYRWQKPDFQQAVRRRWALQYHGHFPGLADTSTTQLDEEESAENSEEK